MSLSNLGTKGWQATQCAGGAAAGPWVTTAGYQSSCPPKLEARLSLGFHSSFQVGVGDALIPFASFVSQVERDSSLGCTVVIGFQEVGAGGVEARGAFLSNVSFLDFSFVGERCELPFSWLALGLIYCSCDFRLLLVIDSDTSFG